MCVIYPLNIFVSNTIITLENENDIMKLQYRNKISTKYFLMNFMVYGSKIINIKNVKEFSSKITEISQSLDDKIDHPCPFYSETDGCGNRFENNEMLAVYNTYNDYITNYITILNTLKNKFKNLTKEIFDNIFNNIKTYKDSTIVPLIIELKRLKKQNPNFNINNLYIISAILNKKDNIHSEQFLEIEFNVDPNNNIILLPTMHERQYKENYHYNFKFIGLLDNIYNFNINSKDIFNINKNYEIKNKNNNETVLKKRCQYCYSKYPSMYTYISKNKYLINCALRTSVNQNFIIHYYKK